MYKIVIDSCGELPEELKDDMHFCNVPLEIEVDGYQITDDGADAYKNAFEIGVCTGSASAFSEELATKEEVEGLYVKTFGKK